MSTAYRDGTFSPIEELPEALRTFNKALDQGAAKALLVGTREEVLADQQALVRDHENAEVSDQIADLKARIEALEGHDGIITEPTREEVAKFGEVPE
jgi:hypothetical protein